LSAVGHNGYFHIVRETDNMVYQAFPAQPLHSFANQPGQEDLSRFPGPGEIHQRLRMIGAAQHASFDVQITCKI
jgi:hypothetical protein